MKYRLASLAPDSDITRAYATFASLDAGLLEVSDQQRSDLMREMEAIQAQAIDDAKRTPDLLEALPVDDRDRAWLTAFAETTKTLCASGRNLRLVTCERLPVPDDYLAVAIEDPGLLAAVKANDFVSAGCAAVRRGDGEPLMWPRILRKVCSNGAIMYVGDGCEHAVTAESLPAVMMRCLSAPVLEESVGRFRMAAMLPAGEPQAVLAAARVVSPPARVIYEWQRAGDDSIWGLVNAVTALAREEPDPARRFAREQDAERILRAAGLEVRPRREHGMRRTLDATVAV